MQLDPALRVVLLALLGVVACRGPESFDPRAFPIGAGGAAVDTAPHDVIPASDDGTGGTAAGTGGDGPDNIEQTSGAGGEADGAMTIPDLPGAAIDQHEPEVASADGSPADGSDAAIIDHCPRAAWTATASRSQAGRSARNAIDGVVNTSWSTGRNQDGSDWFRINLGGVFKLSRITLNNTGGVPGDYPGAYAVFSSLDGVTFKGPLVSGRGAINLTDIQFLPEPMAHIEIRQTGATRPTNWWQIGEVTVDCLP